MQSVEAMPIGTINPITCEISTQHIVIEIEYLMQWVEVILVKNFTAKTIVWFIFEDILTRFGYPKVLMSDHGSQVFNATIHYLTKYFMMESLTCD